MIGYNWFELPSMLQGKCKIIPVQNDLLLVNLLEFTCLLYKIQGDTCYACPTNHKHNSIQASIFKKNILATHPSIHSNLIQLNRQLTQVENRTKLFRRFSIIFAGDFCQLEPILATATSSLRAPGALLLTCIFNQTFPI